MAYTAWSVVFGEQPSASKWNILGTNDAHFAAYTERSGFPVQIKANASAATTGGTTNLPVDATIPQITEGFEVMTQAITPTSATNLLVIEAAGLASYNGASNNIAMALFQDATANALAATNTYQAVSAGDVNLSLGHQMVAGTTSSTTFRIRIGANTGGGSVMFGNGRFGAATHGFLKVTEYRV